MKRIALVLAVVAATMALLVAPAAADESLAELFQDEDRILDSDSITTEVADTDVLDEVVEREPDPEAKQPSDDVPRAETEVAGVDLVRTGAPVLLLVLAAFGLLTGGFAALRRGRRRTDGQSVQDPDLASFSGP